MTDKLKEALAAADRESLVELVDYLMAKANVCDRPYCNACVTARETIFRILKGKSDDTIQT